jgi:hypothetical protein
MIPACGGLTLRSGNVAQGIGTTFAKLTPFSTNGASAGQSQYGSSTIEGDLSIVPDLTNDRLKLYTPADYLVIAQGAALGGGAADLTVQVFINGQAQAAELSTEQTMAASRFNFSIMGIVSVTRTQAPAALLPATVIELWAKASAGQNLTLEFLSFLALRVA